MIKSWGSNIHLNLLTIILLALSLNAHAKLTGTARSNFIENYTKSCYATQKSADRQNTINEKTIFQYCKCNSIYISDILTNGLLQSIEKGEQKFNPNMQELASKYCMKNYSNYQ